MKGDQSNVKNQRSTVHVSVLLDEIIEGLDIHDGDVILDGTLGSGGHSFEIAKRFPKVKIIGLDLDGDALRRSEELLKSINADFIPIKSNYRDLDQVLRRLNLASVDRILLDIGLSSNQFEESGRGFSFQKDEPLLMSFKDENEPDDLIAAEIINHWSEEEIARIIFEYGEEKHSRQIAGAIVRRRKEKLIVSTSDLSEIIRSAVSKNYERGRIDPATRTFQALRIAVNDELENLKNGLVKGLNALSTNGRLAVISFHSLEDRIVKNYFRDWAKSGEVRLINKKPIIATRDEVIRNSRSRSAKLRIIEKIK